jgi:hypothetical protein
VTVPKHQAARQPRAASPRQRWRSDDRLTLSCGRRSTLRQSGARRRARRCQRQIADVVNQLAGTPSHLACVSTEKRRSAARVVDVVVSVAQDRPHLRRQHRHRFIGPLVTSTVARGRRGSAGRPRRRAGITRPKFTEECLLLRPPAVPANGSWSPSIGLNFTVLASTVRNAPQGRPGAWRNR